MLNLTPSASLLNPGGALLVCRIPAFWVCVLVVICFCATGVAVFGAVIQTDSWITFKEEVVWLGGLAGHLTFRNEFSPMWAGHCRALAGRKEASLSIPGEGSKQFSWNSDWTHLRVEIGEAWPVSFPAGQPMSVSLAQREERGLLSFLVHQVNWRLHWGEAEVDMRLKRVGFRRLVHSWCLPRCWFFLSFSTNGYLSFFVCVCVWDIVWCMHIWGEGIQPLWLQQPTCRLQVAYNEGKSEWTVHLHMEVEAVLVTYQPRGNRSWEPWLYSRLGYDPLPALLSVGNLVLVGKTSCFSPPPACGIQCENPTPFSYHLFCW